MSSCREAPGHAADRSSRTVTVIRGRWRPEVPMCGCSAVPRRTTDLLEPASVWQGTGLASCSVRTCRWGRLVERSGQGDVESLETVRFGGDVDGGDGWTGEGELDHQRELAEWSHDQGRTSVDQSQGGEAGAGGRGEGGSGHGQGAVKGQGSSGAGDRRVSAKFDLGVQQGQQRREVACPRRSKVRLN